jgi:hypothetical protein
MAIRILPLLIVSVISGCTSDRLVRDLLLTECNGRGDKPASRAAKCMTAAAYAIAQKKEEPSQDMTSADKDKDKDKDKEADPRFEQWIP